ncbi:MAG: UTRA domain-containing protein, partial [Pseudomonadota bacterium]|nr:UTRA domain-containing protein [Pseudomonadota bacterium]
PAASQYLECKRVRAPREIGMQLALKPSDPLVYLRRLLSFESSPVVLDEIWLPGQLFKKLTAERLAEYNGPLYGLFESEFGTRMIRADERIRAVAAAADAARLLKVAAGSPLLLVERVSYTYGERPVEVRRGLSVTEEYHYRNTLT